MLFLVQRTKHMENFQYIFFVLKSSYLDQTLTEFLQYAYIDIGHTEKLRLIINSHIINFAHPDQVLIYFARVTHQTHQHCLNNQTSSKPVVSVMYCRFIANHHRNPKMFIFLTFLILTPFVISKNNVTHELKDFGFHLQVGKI